MLITLGIAIYVFIGLLASRCIYARTKKSVNDEYDRMAGCVLGGVFWPIVGTAIIAWTLTTPIMNLICSEEKKNDENS